MPLWKAYKVVCVDYITIIFTILLSLWCYNKSLTFNFEFAKQPLTPKMELFIKTLTPKMELLIKKNVYFIRQEAREINCKIWEKKKKYLSYWIRHSAIITTSFITATFAFVIISILLNRYSYFNIVFSFFSCTSRGNPNGTKNL